MRGSSGQSPYWMLIGKYLLPGRTLMTHLALRQAARMTLMLASYLSKFVAETLRASQTSQGAPLIRKTYIFLRQITGGSIHLLRVAACDFWAQCQCGRRKEATPAVGWSKLWPKQRRAKIRAPAVDTACVSDWIGGFCPADLFDDLVPCAGDSGIREKRAGPPSGIFPMAWWTDPGQVPKTIPRCARQSHSSLPKTPISQEP